MNYVLFIPLLALGFAAGSQAQDRIYRCGNEYTNTAPSAQMKGCKLMEGGNVTVVQGTRPAATSTPIASNATAPRPVVTSSVMPSGGPRVNVNEQKARDSDVRQILESELKKAEARQLELQRDYNNGTPDKRGDETTNVQKYQDRVAELKASLARNESDIAGIRRELGRVSSASAAK